MLHTGIISLKRQKSLHKASFCILQKDIKSLLNYKNELHVSELSYVNSLQYDKRKSSFLLGRISAKQALNQYITNKIPFSSFAVSAGVFQFPFFEHLPFGGVQVSISHTDFIGISIVYPEAHPMAIDIEKVNLKNVEAIKPLLTENEIKLTKSYFSKEDQAYTLLWTIKESLSKVLKTGLTLELPLLEIKTLTVNNEKYVTTFKNFSQYKATSVLINSFAISVITPKNTEVDLSDFIACLQNISG